MECGFYVSKMEINRSVRQPYVELHLKELIRRLKANAEIRIENQRTGFFLRRIAFVSNKLKQLEQLRHLKYEPS